MIERYQRILTIKTLFFFLSNLLSYEMEVDTRQPNISLNELYTKTLSYTSVFYFNCEQKNILNTSMFNKDYYLIYIQILTY